MANMNHLNKSNEGNLKNIGYQRIANAIRILKNNVVSVANSTPENIYENMINRAVDSYVNFVGMNKKTADIESFKTIINNAYGPSIGKNLEKYLKDPLLNLGSISEINKILLTPMQSRLAEIAKSTNIGLSKEEKAMVNGQNKRMEDAALGSKLYNTVLEDIAKNPVAKNSA